ncbi:MAG: hypothetical protein ACREA3_05485 [Nitrosotalea sp.]
MENDIYMTLNPELRSTLYSLIDDLLQNPNSMRRMANELKPLTRDNTEVAFGIFIGYVTGGFAEIFFDSQRRSMTQSEAGEVKEIILKRATEMKKAIAYVKSQGN